ncbi:hypothetical protein [Nostoc sp. DSM 114167]|uniref:hypothetical protein n=1 Tax=Nostoc sp. DSM 114167 TaxID=3439050 RepID=UPI004045B934
MLYNTIHLNFRALGKKRIILKLTLQSLEVSISQRITDGICGFELLPWLATPDAKNMVAGDGVLSEL